MCGRPTLPAAEVPRDTQNRLCLHNPVPELQGVSSDSAPGRGNAVARTPRFNTARFSNGIASLSCSLCGGCSYQGWFHSDTVRHALLPKLCLRGVWHVARCARRSGVAHDVCVSVCVCVCVCVWVWVHRVMSLWCTLRLCRVCRVRC